MQVNSFKFYHLFWIKGFIELYVFHFLWEFKCGPSFHVSVKLQNLYNYFFLYLLIVIGFNFMFSVWNATANKLM